MGTQVTNSQTITLLLNRLRAGDAKATEELIEYACNRLRWLVHQRFRRYEPLRRWVDTSDVLQGVLMRLCRALADVQPRDRRHFLCLSSTLIRRELIDLSRHYFGPEGSAVHHATQSPGANSDAVDHKLEPAASSRVDPAVLSQWVELHEEVEKLPDELRDVVDLLWYQDLSQEEAAEVLGVSSKTINRRWREARLILGEAIGH